MVLPILAFVKPLLPRVASAMSLDDMSGPLEALEAIEAPLLQGGTGTHDDNQPWSFSDEPVSRASYERPDQSSMSHAEMQRFKNGAVSLV